MTMARPGASKVLSAFDTISSSFFSSGACPRTRSGTNRATSAVSSHRFTASPSVDEYHEGHVTSPEVNVNQACVLPRSGERNGDANRFAHRFASPLWGQQHFNADQSRGPLRDREALYP